MAKKLRCKKCKKKLKITTFACKCNNCYCTKCKYDHNCTFDYNKDNIEKLKKQLVQCIPTKLQKISS